MKVDLNGILRSITKILTRGARLLVIVLVGLGLLAAAGLVITYFYKTSESYASAPSVKATLSASEGPTDAPIGASLPSSSGKSPRQRESLGDDCNWTLDAAVSDCTKKIKAGRGDAAVYLARAQAYIDLGDYNKAIADTDEALRIKPGLVDALLLRGAARQHKGDYQNALNDYTEALRVESNDVEALTMRGSVLAALGRFDDALEDLNLAIDVGMKSFALINLGDGKADVPIEVARAYYNRGLIWKIKGDVAKAVADFRDAIAANPADPNRRLAIASSLKGKSISEQASVFYKDVNFSPDRNTSDWRQIVMDVKPTRFGDLVMTRMRDEASTSTILLNGVEISRTPVVSTDVFDVYQVGATDVVLVGVNVGGSPEMSLSFLILKAPDKVAAVWDKDFTADSFDSVQVTVTEDGRLLVSFGCRDGHTYAGILSGEKLMVRAITQDDDPMAALECEERPKGGPGVGIFD